MTNWKKILVFAFLTYLVSWSLIGLFFTLGGTWNGTTSTLLSLTYMFIPMLVTIVLQKLVFKTRLKRPLAISFKFNKWFLAAWLIPPVLVFSTLGINMLLPGVEFLPGMEEMLQQLEGKLTPEEIEAMQAAIDQLPTHIFWLGLIGGMIAGPTINAVAAFGEELGWRGFLLLQFQGANFWFSATIIGVIWGIWHAPLILQGRTNRCSKVYVNL